MDDRMTPERFERELNRFYEGFYLLPPPAPGIAATDKAPMPFRIPPSAKPIAYMGRDDLRDLIHKPKDWRSAWDAAGRRYTFMGVPLYMVDVERWLQFALDPR